MYDAHIKRIVRNSVVMILTCFFILFISTWKASLKDNRVSRMKTVRMIPFQHFTKGNEAKPTTIVYERIKIDALNFGRIIDKFVTNLKTVVIFEVIHERFTESANHVAYTAFKNGTDYLLLVCNSSVHVRKELKAYFIQNLIRHPASNIGVVVGVGNTNVETYFILVHRSHTDIFHQLFPNKLNFFNALQWITDIYKPYHITFLNLQISKQPKVPSVTYEYSRKEDNYFIKNARTKIKNYIVSKHTLMVISYSLYGSNSRYIDGAVANAELIKTVYPNWTMWVYHDNTVPSSVLSKLCEMDYITCIDMTGTKFINKMSWRFLIASIDFVSRFIVRDIDSRLSEREKAAVIEWIESGKSFHAMRDHPSHSMYPINGGMWGGTREAIQNMEDLLLSRIKRNDYMHDMNFLNNIVWPIAKHSIYQHDSFSCGKFGGAHPFPSRRIGLEHVGGVYINDKLRKLDTDILQKTKPPRKCTIYG